MSVFQRRGRKNHSNFFKGGVKNVTLLAVAVSRAFFSVWHLPVRIVSLINGEMTVGLILISLVMLFLLGAGFAWLFIRSGSILLVGLVHGLMDFPLIGKDSQLSFIILLAAIGLVELFQLIGRKKLFKQRERRHHENCQFCHGTFFC